MQGFSYEMMLNALLLIACAFSILQPSASGSDYVMLNGTAGSSVELECIGSLGCSSEPKWLYKQDIKSYLHPPLDIVGKGWSLQERNGTCYLRKEAAELTDTGRYDCLLKNDRQIPKLLLKIFENVPKCIVNTLPIKLSDTAGAAEHSMSYSDSYKSEQEARWYENYVMWLAIAAALLMTSLIGNITQRVVYVRRRDVRRRTNDDGGDCEQPPAPEMPGVDNHLSRETFANSVPQLSCESPNTKVKVVYEELPDPEIVTQQNDHPSEIPSTYEGMVKTGIQTKGLPTSTKGKLSSATGQDVLYTRLTAPLTKPRTIPRDMAVQYTGLVKPMKPKVNSEPGHVNVQYEPLTTPRNELSTQYESLH